MFAISAKTGVVDQSGGSNNVTYVGGMGTIETSRNRGFAFDAVDDSITVPSAVSAALGGGLGVTANLWVLPQKFTAATLLNLTVLSTFAKVFIDFHTNNGIRVGGRSTAADSFQAISTTNNYTKTINRYTMITGVIDVANDTISIYRDGQLVVSGSVAFSAATMSADVGSDHAVGMSAAGGNRWQGLIDEVRLFNSVLTAQQISDLYDLTYDYSPGTPLFNGIRGGIRA